MAVSASGWRRARPEVGVRIGRRIIVSPLGFRTRSLFSDTFYSVANLRAVIERYAVLNTSLVIINEETRRNKIAQFLLLRSNSMAAAIAFAVHEPICP
jgi:hypothetical protein